VALRLLGVLQHAFGLGNAALALFNNGSIPRQNEPVGEKAARKYGRNLHEHRIAGMSSSAHSGDASWRISSRSEKRNISSTTLTRNSEG